MKVTLQTIRIVNISIVIAMVSLAIAAVMIVATNQLSKNRYQVFQEHTHRSHVSADALVGCLIAFSVITAAFHVYYTTQPKKYVDDIKDNNKNTLRWVEYSITATLMIFVISVLAGVKTITSLLQICTKNLCVMLLAIVMDGYPGKQETYLVFAIAWILYFTQWASIFIAYQESAEITPGFVDALVGVMFVLFSCFGGLQAYQMFGKYSQDNFLQFELIYSALSFTSKTTLVGIVLGGLVGRKPDG